MNAKKLKRFLKRNKNPNPQEVINAINISMILELDSSDSLPLCFYIQESELLMVQHYVNQFGFRVQRWETLDTNALHAYVVRPYK